MFPSSYDSIFFSKNGCSIFASKKERSFFGKTWSHMNSEKFAHQLFLLRRVRRGSVITLQSFTILSETYEGILPPWYSVEQYDFIWLYRFQ